MNNREEWNTILFILEILKPVMVKIQKYGECKRRVDMIKIAICDEEIASAGRIEMLILDICKMKGIPVDVDVFYNSGALVKEIAGGVGYDLLYLDFKAENEQGIAAAKSIRKMDENVLIVYISEDDKHMMKLFRLNVFAFIRKPIELRLFREIFLEANEKICNNHFYFIFHFKGKEYKLLCKEILYFESIGRKIRIHMLNGEEEVFVGKLSDVAKKLEGGKIPFLRIHQSYLVNYYLIKSRSKTEVTLVNGVKLPISGDRRKDFSCAYSMLLGEEN